MNLKNVVAVMALVMLSSAVNAQDFMSTDGKARTKYHGPIGKRMAHVAIYFDKSEVPPNAHRAGIISITDTRKREKAFEYAKKLAAQYHCEGMLVVQQRAPKVKMSKRAVIVNNNSNTDAPLQDAWVFWAYDVEKDSTE